MNAADIAHKIKTAFGPAWKESEEDGFHSVPSDAKVTGIGVAWTPTLEVLERAVAEKKNLLITKEGPFWEDSAPRPERKVSGPSPTQTIEKTELYRYKRDYIEKNELVLWRLSQNWNGPGNGLVIHGLASALRWEEYADHRKTDSLNGMGAASYMLPPTSLGTLMEKVKSELDAPAARALGSPDAILKSVVLVPGFLSKLDIMSVVGNSKPDAVICGEGCEWEAFEYAEDWITAGWGKAMVMTGMAVSQDAGAKQVAAWLKSLDLGVPISFLPTGSPFTTVVGDHS
jgi:putative NIF3 family GTP cyclohydrolase 1 type 2